MTYACLFEKRTFDHAIVKPARFAGHSEVQKRCPSCGARFYPPARKKGAYSRTGATVSELRAGCAA